MTSEKFEQSYARLNSEQKEAVDTIEGPVIVIAGPGTGKTELLSMRVANILKNADVSAGNILCLTFTDSAAFNMRERIRGLIGREAYRVAIHTFHSFGVEVINKYPEFFYEGATFSPADDLAQVEVLEGILEELRHDDPLGVRHPEMGYVYINDIKSAISNLKKAGITQEEFSSILDRNEKSLNSIKDETNEVFSARISKKQFPSFKKFIDDMSAVKTDEFPVSYMKPLLPVLSLSLQIAFDESETSGKGAPLSNWKSDHTLKLEDGRRATKEEARLPQMRSLAFIYKEYRERMKKLGYYDFDDMLLDVIEALETGALKSELQERFQYILVDEFQDTNDAQMRLLRLLGESEVNEARPNIMAVGDDDQGIFKFQGAELSNVVNFVNSYREVKIVQLRSNYRSTPDILDLAEGVIKKGTGRLENIIESIEKKLVAAGKDLEGGKIFQKSFPTPAYEYHFIVNEIKRIQEEGKKLSDIAIISKYHKELESIALYLHKAKVPINYVRSRDVTNESHIYQLIQMSRFVVSLLRKNYDEVDHFLPEILSYPFWGIDRKTVWEISRDANSGGLRGGWIECMLRCQDEGVKTIANFFIDVSMRSSWEPLEYILDELIGAQAHDMPDEESEDDEPEPKNKSKFTSPFKNYYFGKDRFENNKPEYVSFLSSLRVFVNSLREYKQGEVLKLEDLPDFVDIHKENKIPISDNSPYINAKDSVNLLSAHKAKGLEFDTVFVLSCQDNIWAKTRNSNKLKFPLNLPISPAGDNLDDQLRLFYVAITRAKKNLYLTSYEMDNGGRESSILQFIADYASPEQSGSPRSRGDQGGSDPLPANIAEVLSYAWEGFYRPPFQADEEGILEEIVKDYRMSVTHLNNFLDVINGGPQLFLEQNLLRFPRPKSVSGSYGSAMHRALQLLYLELKKTGTLPSTEKFVAFFEEALKKERLSEPDFKRYSERGREALTAFYKEKKDSFDPEHAIEADFKNQGVAIGDALLSGKIDKLVKVSDGEMSVHDFKTGKAKEKWDERDPQLLRYKRQLIFYKLLVENSREYGQKYQVNDGSLEFIEPKNGRFLDLPLEIGREDTERLSGLIEVVYSKIKNLDFPDVSGYSKDTRGIKEFEEDLLKS